MAWLLAAVLGKSELSICAQSIPGIPEPGVVFYGSVSDTIQSPPPFASNFLLYSSEKMKVFGSK